MVPRFREPSRKRRGGKKGAEKKGGTLRGGGLSLKKEAEGVILSMGRKNLPWMPLHHQISYLSLLKCKIVRSHKGNLSEDLGKGTTARAQHNAFTKE